MPTEISLGKLVKCDDLRSVWKNEAYDFTIWLAEEENLNLLGETLGVEIELININLNNTGILKGVSALKSGQGQTALAGYGTASRSERSKLLCVM